MKRAEAVWLALAGPDLDGKLHVLPQGAEDRRQPFHAETADVGTADAGKISMIDARHFLGLARAPASRIKGLEDRSRQDGFGLPDIRVGVAEIAEHVAAAAHQFKIVFAHRNASFRLLADRGSGRLRPWASQSR